MRESPTPPPPPVVRDAKRRKHDLSVAQSSVELDSGSESNKERDSNAGLHTETVDHHLAHDEMKRLEEKRAYNRMNAARARARIKIQIGELSNQVEKYASANMSIQQQNEDLTKRLNQLMDENKLLRSYIFNPTHQVDGSGQYPSHPSSIEPQSLAMYPNASSPRLIQSGQQDVTQHQQLLLHRLNQQQHGLTSFGARTTGRPMHSLVVPSLAAGIGANLNDHNRFLLEQMLRLHQQSHLQPLSGGANSTESLNSQILTQHQRSGATERHAALQPSTEDRETVADSEIALNAKDGQANKYSSSTQGGTFPNGSSDDEVSSAEV